MKIGNLPRLLRKRQSQSTFSSREFWSNRYVDGGNSGAGSYGRLAEFKAAILNDITHTLSIRSAIEFGCGDGNNLSLYNIPNYLGLDVSAEAIRVCREKFPDDERLSFGRVQDHMDRRADMTLSLDVIYHLVEQHVFDNYLNQLFGAAKKAVVIYSSCCNFQPTASHVRHRNFLRPIADRFPQWTLQCIVPNLFPAESIEAPEPGTTFADFYIYTRADSEFADGCDQQAVETLRANLAPSREIQFARVSVGKVKRAEC